MRRNLASQQNPPTPAGKRCERIWAQASAESGRAPSLPTRAAHAPGSRQVAAQPRASRDRRAKLAAGLVETLDRENRGFRWAEIRRPGEAPLLMASGHLACRGHERIVPSRQCAFSPLPMPFLPSRRRCTCAASDACDTAPVCSRAGRRATLCEPISLSRSLPRLLPRFPRRPVKEGQLMAAPPVTTSRSEREGKSELVSWPMELSPFHSYK